MRISFVRHSLLNRGGDKMVLVYASHLADSGHEVHLETNKVDTVFPINDKITIKPLAFKGQLGTILSAVFGKRPVDLVIADIIPLAFALHFKNGNKVIYFAQDNNLTHYRNPLMRLLVMILNYIGLSYYQIRTIAVSTEISCILSKKYKANIEKVIQNGVDTSLFYPEPSESLRNGKSGRRSIVILSRSDQRKGFDVAQKVVEKVATACSIPIEIWTVGEKAEEKFSGIAHRDFGYVQEPTLRAILSSADVFLYPSRSEGSPLMVMEAFACRCPVVTTEAVPYAKHRINAMVSKVGDIDSLADHVCHVLGSSELAVAIAARGYDYAQNHTLQAAKASFENTINSICKLQHHC